jgi:hypothetical protein
MLCDEVRDSLYEYIYDELSEEKKKEIAEHFENCSVCRKEYEEVKKLLIDDMKPFLELRNDIEVPKELFNKVNKKINPSPFYRIQRYTVAACFLIFLFYAVPVAAYYIIENTALNKYISFDNGLIKDIEQGKLQMVNKSTTMKDITLRVDGVISNKDKTTILLTVKVPEGKDINYALPTGGINDITIEDQFGKKYNSKGSAITVESANEDGEATVIIYTEPLEFWTYKLTLRVTTLECGRLVLKEGSSSDNSVIPDGKLEYQMEKKKNIYGSWQVKFYIDRSHKE